MGAYLKALTMLPAERYSHSPLLGRISGNCATTAYDGDYIALTEAMNATLFDQHFAPGNCQTDGGV
jgi:hypothetical protein